MSSGTSRSKTGRPLVVSLNEIGAQDLALVGTKAANLGEAMRAGAIVPRGFCVTTRAWDEVRMALRARIRPLLIAVDACDAEDHERLGELGAALRRAICDAPVSDELQSSIAARLQSMDGASRWAIRGSPTIEDFSHTSVYGAQESLLNVSADAVVDAVRACWASLYSERALIDWRRAGIEARAVSMAVVVQRMLYPRISGLMYTSDPDDPSQGVAVAVAAWGLPQPIRTGAVEADSYRFRLADGSCVDREIVRKDRALVAAVGGGTELIDVTDRRAAQVLLDDEHCERLAALGHRLEGHFEAPQEIEWCLVDDALFTVQSRPITNLFPEPLPVQGFNPDALYVSLGHLFDDVEPVAPLSVDVAAFLCPNPDLVAAGGGRVFLDLEPLLRSRTAQSWILPTLATLVPPLAARVQEALRDGHTKLGLRQAMPVLGLWLRTARELLRPDPRAARRHLRRSLDELMREWREGIAQAELPSDRLAGCRRALEEMFPRFIWPLWFPALAAGELALRRLDRAPLRHSTLSTSALEQLEELAQVARANPELAQWVESDHTAASHGHLKEELAGGRMIPDARDFWGLWDEFVARWGHQASRLVDVATPRWREDPRVLHDLVSSMVRNAPTTARPVTPAEPVRQLATSTSMATRLLERHADEQLALWEVGVDALFRLLDLVRENVLATGVVLSRKQQLSAPEDVFWVRWHDVARAITEGGDLSELVALYRSRHLRFRGLVAPEVVGSSATHLREAHKTSRAVAIPRLSTSRAGE